MARKPTGNPPGRPEAGDLTKAQDLLDNISTKAELEHDASSPYDGLSERQQLVLRLKQRGLSQQAIAKFMGVSQPVISKELKRIREYLADRGASIDQDATIGEAASIYEEVEYRAWELYNGGDNNDKAKALALIMQAREKHTKLLMDLGRLRRAGNTSTVEVHVSPLVKQMEDQERRVLVQAVIQSQLSNLDEPEPPTSLDEEILDAELVE